MKIKYVLFYSLITLSSITFAANPLAQTNYNPIIYLWLVIFIFLSRGLSVVKKIGLPLVVGEIMAGVIMGDMHLVGIGLFNDTSNNVIIQFLAEIGSIFLMFEIGIASKFSDLKKNMRIGLKLAIIGSILTFGGGFLISKYLIPNSSLRLNLLLGIICAATATGISAKTFKDMGILRTREVKIVLVASILDELISVFCFAIISSILLETVHSITHISVSILQVCSFFVFAVIFGQLITPLITHWSTKIHAGLNMKVGVLLIICFLFSWIAYILGLAFVVGAFVAGLILDQVYFKSFSRSNFFNQLRHLSSKIQDRDLRNQLNNVILTQEDKNLEEMLKPLSHFFVPVFFIYIGLQLNMENLLQKDTLIATFTILAISFIGRIISGYLINDNGVKLNRLVLGLGMTPIGEAGLIFAVFGKSLGIVNNTVMSAVVSTLVIASIVTPIFIKLSIKRYGVHHD